MTPPELMRLHVEALFRHDARGRLLDVNQWDGGLAPRFFLGRTNGGNLWRFRHDLDEATVAALTALCKQEPVLEPPPPLPVLARSYASLLATPAGTRTYTGPACVLPTDLAAPQQPTVALSVSDRAQLVGELAAWRDDLVHRQPVLGALHDGHVVALCASVRITASAHEAGVETLAANRQRGHGIAVVAAWARAVQASGAVALYSTSTDNVASQRLAARLGATCFGVAYHIT